MSLNEPDNVTEYFIRHGCDRKTVSFARTTVVDLVEPLLAIVDKLPKDAEGNVYPPPQALLGKVFYHPSHLGPAPLLFSQLFWHSDGGYWGIGCGGWDVPLSECFESRGAAEEAKS